MSRFAGIAVVCSFALALTAPSRAQITQIDDTTSPPIEGVGHDYIKALSETVNPANGSVSLRINVPVAKGRGLTIPFSFGYDSNGFRHLKPGNYPNYGTAFWVSNTGYTGQGGWTYAIPQLNFDSWTGTIPVLTGINNGQPIYTNYYCYYDTSFTLREGSGAAHALGIGTHWFYTSNGASQYCTGASVISSGDPQVSATFTNPMQGLGQSGFYYHSPLVVTEADGTTYYFSTLPGESGDDNTQYALPTYIEDRNGNKITVTGNTFTDTLGRTLLSYTGLGPAGQTNTVSVSGLNYQVTWKSVSANYSVSPRWAGQSNIGWGCSPPPAISDTQTVVSKIALPNSQAYNFYYGNDVTPHNATTNPYGLLSEVDYPSGAWVRYTWQISDTMNELADYPGYIDNACGAGASCPTPAENGCMYQYKSPVVASRTVSFGGSTPALTQTFIYSTTWNDPIAGDALGITWSSKSTSVTTTDNVLGKQNLTQYVYGSVTPPLAPFTYNTVGTQIPVESTISYYDWGNTTTPVRVTTKHWYDQYDLKDESVQEAGKTSQTTYCYVGTNCVPSMVLAQLKEKDDFDFGASAPTLRTVTSYQPFTFQNFAGAPGVIADAPCQTVVYDGGTTVYAETDYYYDGGTSLCAPISTATPVSTSVTVVSGTHDDSNFPQTSTIPRGNLTKKIHWANTGTSPTTTYAYDSAGQVLSVTDACGNASCADMTGTTHTTNFSYANVAPDGSSNFTVLSGGQNVSYTPTGNLDAYVTQITDALGHTSDFKYDFNNGQLTKSTDANSQITTYLYNDPFARPKQVNHPDGGITTISYNDSPYNPSTPSPSVTTTTAISSTLNVVNTVAFDGMEHTVETILSSDPSTADYVNTSYAGIGSPYQVTNPHRATTSTTDGTTTYGYDGLGRTTSVTRPGWISCNHHLRPNKREQHRNLHYCHGRGPQGAPDLLRWPRAARPEFGKIPVHRHTSTTKLTMATTH